MKFRMYSILIQLCSSIKNRFPFLKTLQADSVTLHKRLLLEKERIFLLITYGFVYFWFCILIEILLYCRLCLIIT